MAHEKGALPRAYLRIDPHLASNHECAGEYMKLLEAGHDAPRRGRFKNIAVLRAGVGRRIADRCVARKDVVGHGAESDCFDEEGRRRGLCPPEYPHLYIAGWDEWQEGDYTVSERMKRVRARKRNSAVTSA